MQFAVLSQFANNQLNFNNGTITGDIGLGSPRQFTISNGSVNGNIRFAGAGDTTGLTPDPDPGSNPASATLRCDFDVSASDFTPAQTG